MNFIMLHTFNDLIACRNSYILSECGGEFFHFDK
jgi:hypothetical protein